MRKHSLASREGRGCVSSALESPAGCQESVHTHRPSGMDPRRGESNLCTQTKPKAIRKPRACIVKDTRTVHTGQKLLGDGIVFGHHAVCVTTAMLMDVVDSLLNAIHVGDRSGQLSILHGETRSLRQSVPQLRSLIPDQMNPSRLKR